MSTPLHSAAILGATGLVGSALVRLAAASGRYSVVRALARRPLADLPSGVESHLLDLDALVAGTADDAAALLGADHVFCCLGTTIKQAGSEAAFRRVDHDYPLAAARAALAAGAKRLVVVTAVGADSRSSVFYNRVKGELEDALRTLAFPEGITVLHPSLLLGERRETRAGEAVASVFMRAARPLFGGPLLRYRAIRDEEVARAMLAAAAEASHEGFRVLEGAELFARAR